MSATSNDQVLRYKGFDVEIKGVDSAPAEIDSSWVTIAGGVLATAAPPSNGPNFFDEELVLRGPVTPGRKAFPRWVNDTLAGRDPYRTVTITLIPLDDDKPRETIVFYDAFLTACGFPRLDLVDPCPSPPIEELRFSFSRFIRF